jgi:hypothetical protein
MTMTIHRLLAATATAAIVLTGWLLKFPETLDAQVDREPRAPQLAGARYDTMLALARYLDQTTQGALEGADDDVGGGSTDARFLSAIRAFAASTSELLRTMSERQTTSPELPSELADLQQRARLFGDRIRAAHALQNIYDEWDAIADVLQRMTLLLEGHDVDVPKTFVVPPLAGSRLRDLRRLASELETSATRAHGKASRAVRKYPDRGEQFVGELRHFSMQSRELRRRADAAKVDPQGIGPVVDHLLEEAQQADRRMRDANVFTEVWDDSGRSIIILQRMANLVRS